MGNPALYWNGNAIDLGSMGVQSLEGGRMFEGSRVANATGETTINRLFDSFEIKKGPFSDNALFRQLEAFQSWALRGKPFGFAFDSADRVDTVLDADPAYIEKLTNGDLESWDDANPTRPTGWAITEVGTTTVRRATQREDVAEGLFGLMWAVDGSASQSTAQLPDSASVGSAAACKLTYSLKGNGYVQVRIQNAASSKYLQADGSWGVGAVWITAGVAGNPVDGGLTIAREFGLVTHSFTNDTSAGALKITVRNAATAGAVIWADDFRLAIESSIVVVRAAGGITATGGKYKLGSITTFEQERVTTASAAGTSITLSARPLLQFHARDIFRSEDWYPYLTIDGKGPILQEQAGSLWTLEVKARETLTGRY